jgi:hypothetical protein
MLQAYEERLALGCRLHKQHDLPGSIKQWRMAVDQAPLHETATRAAIMCNIGVAFAQQGCYFRPAGVLPGAQQLSESAALDEGPSFGRAVPYMISNIHRRTTCCAKARQSL